MIKQSEDGGCGTSFYGITITTTPQNLIDNLDEPEYFSNDGCDKTNMDYYLETDSGVVFTVYDWKEYAPLQMNTKYDFHIGGYSQSDCLKAKHELINLLWREL